MRTEEFTSWHETHFEVVAFITECRNDEDNEFAELVNEQGGTGLFYELAKDWTDEFEKQHQGTAWGEEADWLETIEAYLENKAIEYIQANKS